MTELTPTESENPLSGYGKTVSHVVVGLKTVKGTKQLRLDPTIYEAILKEKIVVGDVVYIEANTGAVKVSFKTPFSREFLSLNWTFLASRTLRCIRRIVRFGIRNLRAASQGRRAQAKRTRSRYHPRRPRRRQRSPARRTGHYVRHGLSRPNRPNGSDGQAP